MSLPSMTRSEYNMMIEVEEDRNMGSHQHNNPSFHSSLGSNSIDRHNRFKPAKIRAKFEKATWDGKQETFEAFKQSIDGHLLQVGAGYLIDKTFVEMYKKLRQDYFKSDVFWTIYNISYPQAIFDREYFYGILITATRGKKNKIMLSHQVSKDGIPAWSEFLHDFDNEGSDDFRLQH